MFVYDPLNTYDVGDLIRLGSVFKVGSTPTDPSSVLLFVRKPDGSQLQYTYPASLSRSATGTYYKDLFVDDEGIWAYRFVATGTVYTAEESRFMVRLSNL